jgi:hypothetical protein
MDQPISVNFTPLQMLLSVAFQLWIIIFPIIIIRKLNHVTAILHEQFYPESDSSSS